jgi:FtsP/CotA-like multicopper oxidase with cupredoxin domain
VPRRLAAATFLYACRAHARRWIKDFQMKNTRRTFVQGLTSSALLLGAGRPVAFAHSASSQSLSGSRVQLLIDERPVNYTGARRLATAINGQVPGPLLRWREGEEVTVQVTNRLAVQSSIHWHGVIVPADMDGVPGLSYPGIAPGETFSYRFKVNQHGTYWYHAHSRFQEQVGLYGPIIIEPRAGEQHGGDRDYVVLLSDWTDEDPEHIYAMLKRQSEYYNSHRRTVADLYRDIRREGLRHAASDWDMWARMRMDPTDLLDVSAATYTYLMNGASPAGNWSGQFRPGERVRLRFINASSMTFFDVRIPGLPMSVIAADGQEVDPITVDEFRIGGAETLDVIVAPADQAYTIFAQAMDRTGYARGTLTPGAGVQAAVPALEPAVQLELGDMGMDMRMQMTHTSMTHQMSPMWQHTRAEHGPGVDMLVQQPSGRLDDPGVGLRNNGRRVLTYADLHTIGGSVDPREPQREIELHLTGHMERFMWSFDGEAFSQSQPLRFRHGELLRIVLINDTMMTHPIHLHGMWSEVENEEGAFALRKHTVSVQPAQRLSYRVSADALGRWAYHCHLLYHMEAGMFREVVVA